MLVHIKTAGLHGVEALPVTVEVSLTTGLPSFSVVGLPRSAVREGRERVVSALRHLGVSLPPRRITVNLAPADEPKEGTGFDLPLAVALLVAAGKIRPACIQEVAFLGELGLDGRIRPVRGVLARALGCSRAGARALVVAPENAAEAMAVPGLPVRTVPTLEALMGCLAGTLAWPPPPASRASREREEPEADLSDVEGQPLARRALEIAAAGGHNLLLVGPPGVGKTLLARRMPGILPPLEPELAMEVTSVHSAAGLLPAGAGLLSRPPFRAPHHSVTGAGLVGGGSPLRPGEATLAHGGVLFLDELPEFRRQTLDLLRQPLEDGVVRLSRARGVAVFPARFSLVAAMNPCPCGFYGDGIRDCQCDPGQVLRYRSRVSGPLMDRIDLQVRVAGRVVMGGSGGDAGARAGERSRGGASGDRGGGGGESTAHVRERVLEARARQMRRAGDRGPVTNARLSAADLRRLVSVSGPVARLLQAAQNRLGLSPRAYHRLLKVARTIADLAGDAELREDHAAEAIHFRELDRPVR